MKLTQALEKLDVANPFQLLLKGCTIEAFLNGAPVRIDLFQLLLKGCTIEASPSAALIQQEKQRFSCC